MLLSHLSEYACEWANECNSVTIRNDRKTFISDLKHSWAVRKHSCGLAKVRNMLLNFVRKAYSQNVREQSYDILNDGKTFVVIVRRL